MSDKAKQKTSESLILNVNKRENWGPVGGRGGERERERGDCPDVMGGLHSQWVKICIKVLCVSFLSLNFYSRWSKDQTCCLQPKVIAQLTATGSFG